MSMKLDHLAMPCGLMESIDVLCDQRRESSGRLDLRKRTMSSIRSGGVELLPTSKAPGPVAPPRVLASEKLLI